MKAPVSVCMIARDEEKFIGSCLESIRPFVEEIVVVDTGSQDRTPQIAKAYADVVKVDASFLDEDGFIRDFSEAREVSYALGSQPWRMWLDADDVVDGGEAIAPFIKHLESKRLDEGVPCIGELRYLYTFTPDGKCNQDFLRERLTPIDAGFKWTRAIHESLKSEQEHRRIPADVAPLIIHRGQNKPRNERNLRILKRLAADPSNIDPMIPYYIGNTIALMGDNITSLAWFEQCLTMAQDHKIKKTAHKHIVTNHLQLKNLDEARIQSERFLERYPLCASAYFCSVKTTMIKFDLACSAGKHDTLDVKELQLALERIEHAVTLKREDDDVFLNPWEWDVWAPMVKNYIIRGIAAFDAPEGSNA